MCIRDRPGSTYYCRVRAVDLVGNKGPWSDSHGGTHVYGATPTVALGVNDGGLRTANRVLNLAIGYDDLLGADAMRISEDGSFVGAEWMDYTGNAVYALQGADGEHTVHVQVRNTLGIVGEASGSILLDTTPPLITFETKQGARTDRSSYKVKGHVEPGATLVFADGLVPVEADGSFVVEVPLVVGSNLVDLVAADDLGNSATGTITIEREPASEWTPMTTSVSLGLIVLVVVLVAVMAYMYMRGKKGGEWEEIPPQ